MHTTCCLDVLNDRKRVGSSQPWHAWWPARAHVQDSSTTSCWILHMLRMDAANEKSDGSSTC
jgi:hypothetical protein